MSRETSSALLRGQAMGGLIVATLGFLFFMVHGSWQFLIMTFVGLGISIPCLSMGMEVRQQIGWVRRMARTVARKCAIVVARLGCPWTCRSVPSPIKGSVRSNSDLPPAPTVPMDQRRDDGDDNDEGPAFPPSSSSSSSSPDSPQRREQQAPSSSSSSSNNNRDRDTDGGDHRGLIFMGVVALIGAITGQFLMGIWAFYACRQEGRVPVLPLFLFITLLLLSLRLVCLLKTVLSNKNIDIFDLAARGWRWFWREQHHQQQQQPQQQTPLFLHCVGWMFLTLVVALYSLWLVSWPVVALWHIVVCLILGITWELCLRYREGILASTRRGCAWLLHEAESSNPEHEIICTQCCMGIAMLVTTIGLLHNFGGYRNSSVLVHATISAVPLIGFVLCTRRINIIAYVRRACASWVLFEETDDDASDNTTTSTNKLPSIPDLRTDPASYRRWVHDQLDDVFARVDAREVGMAAAAAANKNGPPSASGGRHGSAIGSDLLTQMPHPMQLGKRIAIVGLMGLIGVGKTTLCGNLSNAFHRLDTTKFGLHNSLYEHVNELWLKAFYADPKGMATKFQNHQCQNCIRTSREAIIRASLYDEFQSHSPGTQGPHGGGGNTVFHSVVVDRTSLGNMCFAAVQASLGHISSKDFELYKEVLSEAGRAILLPQLVYLDAPVEVVYKRIQQRAVNDHSRECEQQQGDRNEKEEEGGGGGGVSKEYLSQLQLTMNAVFEYVEKHWPGRTTRLDWTDFGDHDALARQLIPRQRRGVGVVAGPDYAESCFVLQEARAPPACGLYPNPPPALRGTRAELLANNQFRHSTRVRRGLVRTDQGITADALRLLSSDATV